MAKGKSITRELVEEKAIQMAKENGIAGVTYNQLARELDIRPQSMYRYVANIREVHVIVIRAFLDEMTDALAEGIQNKPPLDTLRAFSENLYDISHEKPWYYEALDLLHQYDGLEELNGTLTRLAGLIQTPIRSLKPQEYARYTQLFMAVTIGYGHMGLTHFPLSSLRYDRDTYMQSMNEFIDKIFSPD